MYLFQSSELPKCIIPFRISALNHFDFSYLINDSVLQAFHSWIFLNV